MEGLTVPSPVSELLTPIVTFAEGWLLSKTVNVKDSYTKRPTYESIRKSWYRVSTERCENLVEEKGYIVGVIKNVVVGVVQVSGWKRLEIREGENQGRVEFTGELLSDHLTIDYTLTDITVSGTLQGFNFPYQEEKES